MGAYEAERAELLKGFAANLRGLREARSLSQEALADAASLHRTHVSFLERAKREPSLSTLLILADTLDVSLDRLAQRLGVPQERRPARPHNKRRRSS